MQGSSLPIFARTIVSVLSAFAMQGSMADEVDFANEIQTTLARRCYACHGPDQQEGGIRFDDRATLVVEADSGELAITPGKAEASELIRRVTSHDEAERMPPEGKPLTEREIESLKKWIDGGAEYAQHWAFQPVRNPPLPKVADPSWPNQPLDHFVLARLDQAGLQPVRPADPRTIIRRLYMDVTGLPPDFETAEQLAAHWDDGAYERLVDRLLAEPSFGERWARVWLDVVRYAETNSFERDNPKPNAYRYRDYVIAAMNSDKPYDQFMREQIAGDELDEVTNESLTATGYYRLGLWDDEPADPKQAIFDGFDDLVTTTSQGMLGLTLNCARCHDHKIDPLTQKDYYRMVAFMRDVTPYGDRGNQVGNNQIDMDPELAEQHIALEKREKKIQQRTRKIEKEAIVKMPAPDQRATEGPERSQVLAAKMGQYTDAETYLEYQQLQTELEDVQQQRRSLPARQTILGLAKLHPEPVQTHVLLRGSPHNEGDPVDPAFPKLLGGGQPIIPTAAADANSAGRRRVLADWLASKDNWMTPRVMVNRIWLHYFGRGIVRSPNNFGLMGDPPTHPDLIDHLATQLVQHDWSLKNIHRTILLSSTYRLGTHDQADALARDPANHLFWRQNLRRLSAEQVRDAVLSVTGQLNGEQYGESIYPTLSQEVLASQSRPGAGWGNSSSADQARRSIYIHVKRSLQVPLLTAFDFPDSDISCEARFLTTQPGQALTMLNSDWMQEQADHLLARVQREVGPELPAQAQRCLELTQCRTADQADVDELLDLVERLRKKHKLSDDEARHAMCLVALNLNEFLYID